MTILQSSQRSVILKRFSYHYNMRHIYITELVLLLLLLSNCVLMPSLLGLFCVVIGDSIIITNNTVEC